MAGSLNQSCENDGQCSCKHGYNGLKCDKCKDGFYLTTKGCRGINFLIELRWLKLLKEVSKCAIFLHSLLVDFKKLKVWHFNDLL